MELGEVDAADLTHARISFVVALTGGRRWGMVNGVPEIRVDGVSKQFRSGALALQNVSLQVEKGEFVSLLGPSGCGKSTLLRLVSGLTEATAGTVAVKGMPPANARELMSFIFQDATLLPWRTVAQNVGLGLELEHV